MQVQTTVGDWNYDLKKMSLYILHSLFNLPSQQFCWKYASQIPSQSWPFFVYLLASNPTVSTHFVLTMPPSPPRKHDKPTIVYVTFYCRNPLPSSTVDRNTTQPTFQPFCPPLSACSFSLPGLHRSQTLIRLGSCTTPSSGGIYTPRSAMIAQNIFTQFST